MNGLKIDGEVLDWYSICLAHYQLESDYNIDGWLRERPSNQRRMASTGVQLSRMQFNPGSDWVDINADPQDDLEGNEDSVRFIYCSNVLKWNLPIDKELAQTILRTFTSDVLVPFNSRLKVALDHGYWPDQKNTQENTQEIGRAHV